MSIPLQDLFGQPQQISFYEPNLFERLAGRQNYSAEDLLPQVQSNFAFLERKLSVAPSQVRAVVSMDPVVMHGNPVFRDTRIPIYIIVEELADGTRLEELTDGYPALTLERIRHALDFVSSVLRIYDEDVSH